MKCMPWYLLNYRRFGTSFLWKKKSGMDWSSVFWHLAPLYSFRCKLFKKNKNINNISLTYNEPSNVSVAFLILSCFFNKFIIDKFFVLQCDHHVSVIIVSHIFNILSVPCAFEKLHALTVSLQTVSLKMNQK